jgi:hypothetical protein
MTGQKHCCANCYFFQDSGLSGQGHCTHPKRNEPGGGPGRLVRKQELACRNGWGDNLFTDPATMDTSAADDRLVAKSTVAPTGKSRPAPTVEPDDRLVARDYSPNTAAQNDQDDRTASMQRGPGDALRSAQSRYRDRQSGATRRADIVVPEPVPQADSQSPASEASTAANLRPAPQRSIIPAVPRDEIRTRHRDDSTIWDEIPTIAADVELPLLREQFRLSGQSSSPEPTTASPKEPSRFELTLRKAEEHRRAKAREAGGSDDRITSTSPVPESADVHPQPAPADDSPIDEVVRYQPQRGTELDRFRVAPEPIETDEAYLDEDYELDRTWRAEAPSRQREDRWWKSRGRYRLFGNNRNNSDGHHAMPTENDIEPAFEPERPHTPDPAPLIAAPDMTITWDDRTLAPQPQPAHIFASLDYLDDDPDRDDRPLPAWRAVESPFASTPPPAITEQVGERIAGTDRRLHRWTYREVPPEPASSTPKPAAHIVQPAAPAPLSIAEPQSMEAPDIDLDTVIAPDFDIRRIVARNAEPLLDMTIDIAPDVPRECGTCRHFRASGTGERGWCTNTWAFPHRPLVNADTVHCTSTIGCWWLPADDDWDPEEYFDWLDQETPRADRLIAALYGEEPDRHYGN